MDYTAQLLSNAPMLISLVTTGLVYLCRQWLPIVAHKPKSILIGVSVVAVTGYAFFHYQATGETINIVQAITTTVAQAAGVYGLTKPANEKTLGTM